MDKNKHVPTPRDITWSYILGWGCVALGVLLLLAAVGQVAWSTYRGVQRVQAPGRTTLELKKEGLYVGFHQHRGDGAPPVEDLERLGFAMFDAQTFLPVMLNKLPVARARMGANGFALFNADIVDPGSYILESFFAENSTGTPVEVFVAHESLQANRADLAVGLIVFLVLAGFGGWVIVRTARRARELPGWKPPAPPPRPPRPPKPQDKK